MITEITTLVDRIVEAGSPFIASPKESLNNDRIGVLYHVVGNDESLSEFLGDIEEVQVGEETLPFEGHANVPHSDVHFVNRVPIFAANDAHLGLEQIPKEDGQDNLRQFLNGSPDHTDDPSKTVDFERLINQLAAEGAVAIGVEKSVFELGDAQELPLKVYMPPAHGAEIVRSVASVRVGDDTFDLTCQFTIHGPEFGFKVPLYASDSILGLSPVTVDEGMSNLEGYLSGPESSAA